MWGKLTYEDGLPVAGGTKRVFNEPQGYVKFQEKLSALRARPDWVEPPRWINGWPTQACWNLLQKFPPAVDDMGDADGD